MKNIKRIFLILLILFSCVGCDQATKTIARDTLPKSDVISFLNDTIRLQYIENQGAFLSLGATIPVEIRSIVLIFLVGLFLLSMVFYLFVQSKLNRNQIISLSFVAGGGIGNLIDRIFNQGRVVDFLNLGVGHLRTGIFNIADVAITLGIIWYFFVSLKTKKIYTTAIDRNHM